MTIVMATNGSTTRHIERAHLRVGLFCFALFAWILGAQSVAGHAALISTSPEDGAHLDGTPSEITLEFSEPVGIVDGGMMLFEQGDDPHVLAPIADGSIVRIPIEFELSDGAYLVQWRVISADSHPLAGTISLSIGDTDDVLNIDQETAPEWVKGTRLAAMAVKYVGLLASIGVVVFGVHIANRDWIQIDRLLLRLFALSMIGTVSEVPLAAMEYSNQLLYPGDELWSTVSELDRGYRQSAILPIALLIPAFALCRIGRETKSHQIIVGCLAWFAALSQVLSGHSRSNEPVWLTMVADGVHITVAGIWLGGILMLSMGLLRSWKGFTFSTEESTASAVSRFSTLAGCSLILLAISGLVMGVIILDSLQALWKSDYGIALFIKVALVGMVMVIAGVNRYVLIPRIVSVPATARVWLRRLVGIELVILLTVTGVTARLVQLNPHVDTTTSEAAQTFSFADEKELDEAHTIRAEVVRTRPSVYEVQIRVMDAEGRTTQFGDSLDVAWDLPEQGLGPISQMLVYDETTGSYSGTVVLPLLGAWNLAVRVSIDRFTELRTIFHLTID